ncbi:hypothetical protein EDD85DRAFT_793174 [Armillaria nabsnona]|nr:hypothetical protein EDD85DRAFT_793174 [Armillaria nabsnona]
MTGWSQLRNRLCSVALFHVLAGQSGLLVIGASTFRLNGFQLRSWGPAGIAGPWGCVSWDVLPTLWEFAELLQDALQEGVPDKGDRSGPGWPYPYGSLGHCWFDIVSREGGGAEVRVRSRTVTTRVMTLMMTLMVIVWMGERSGFMCVVESALVRVGESRREGGGVGFGGLSMQRVCLAWVLLEIVGWNVMGWDWARNGPSLFG